MPAPLWSPLDGSDGADDFGGGLSDEELAELALAADPGAPLGDDAVPIMMVLPQFGPVLPQWYMPHGMHGRGRRWKLPLVVAVVAAFLLIDAMGLCNTYGVLGL